MKVAPSCVRHLAIQAKEWYDASHTIPWCAVCHRKLGALAILAEQDARLRQMPNLS